MTYDLVHIDRTCHRVTIYSSDYSPIHFGGQPTKFWASPLCPPYHSPPLPITFRLGFFSSSFCFLGHFRVWWKSHLPMTNVPVPKKTKQKKKFFLGHFRVWWKSHLPMTNVPVPKNLKGKKKFFFWGRGPHIFCVRSLLNFGPAPYTPFPPPPLSMTWTKKKPNFLTW